MTDNGGFIGGAIGALFAITALNAVNRQLGSVQKEDKPKQKKEKDFFEEDLFF
jgi:hypothetical protein